MNVFEPGDIVMTNFGEGKIVSFRTIGTDDTILQYTVRLFSRASEDPTYVGTVFHAEDVFYNTDF